MLIVRQIGGQIWMNCARGTLQTLSIASSGDWWVQSFLHCCEGFKCCQMETPGSSEQLGVLPTHYTNAQFLLRALWDERGKGPKLPWCPHLPKGHGGVSEHAVSDWKACTSIPKRPFYNSHLAQDMSSAEVMPVSFVLCFTKLIHPSFWATTALGNSWILKAEVEGQQPFMNVDAPQRRWACWTSHLEGEKQFPFSKSWHSGERRPMITTSPGDLSAYFAWGTPQQHLLGPTAPGTAPGLTCIKGCDHLKTLVPCQQNQKILVCMKGNKAPITVHRITIIHPIFFPGSLHSYRGGAGRLQKYMCK